jgi:mannose-1-phosphate guanylyltransferase
MKSDSEIEANVDAELTNSANHWALVLAAGDGRRLQDLTRTASGTVVPKQFCSLHGGSSFVEETVHRAEAVVPRERICAVVASSHRSHWSRHLECLPNDNIIAQPRNRGTAIGILLPLLHIMKRDPEARIILLPSDHHVQNEARFAASLRAAMSPSESAEIVLLGIEPHDPDPELGYIVPHPDDHAGFLHVDRFVEKPSFARASELIRQGALWNAFIIAADARALLQLFERCCPDIVAKMRRLDCFDTSLLCPSGALAELYDELPDLDFSRAILQGQEQFLQVLAVPECGWSDLGTPQWVAETLRRLRLSALPNRSIEKSRAAVVLAAHHEMSRQSVQRAIGARA